MRTEVLVTARRIAAVASFSTVALRWDPIPLRLACGLRPAAANLARPRGPNRFRARRSPSKLLFRSILILACIPCFAYLRRRILERSSIGIESSGSMAGSPSMEPQLRSLAWEFRGIDGRKVVAAVDPD